MFQGLSHGFGVRGSQFEEISLLTANPEPRTANLPVFVP